MTSEVKPLSRVRRASKMVLLCWNGNLGRRCSLWIYGSRV